MGTVAVTGGTGHLGREVVALLRQHGHEVRVLARTPGAAQDVEWVRGDLATGHGIEAAVAGADVVIHAATNSPAARRGYLLPVDFVRTPTDVDVEGTRRLLAEAEKAGVSHFVHISIVGLDKVRLPYGAAKRAAEALVRSGAVPWTIVRGTAFYWLWDRMLSKQLWMPLWPMPSLPMDPVDSDDFAKYVVTVTNDGPGGHRPDFAGPQRLTLAELAGQYLQHRGIRRRIMRLPVPKKLEEAAGGLPADDAVRGATTWGQWLDRHHL